MGSCGSRAGRLGPQLPEGIKWPIDVPPAVNRQLARTWIDAQLQLM
jgi:hypothetical protein